SKTKTSAQRQDCAQPVRPTAAFRSAVARYSICCATGSISARSNTRAKSCPASSQRSWKGSFLMQFSRSSPNQPTSSCAPADDRSVIAEQLVRIDVQKDRLIIRFTSTGTEEGSPSTDGQLLSIPWQKPPSRKSRQILIPLGAPRNEVRPIRVERRARLVNAIARGRRWLDEIVSGSATN